MDGPAGEGQLQSGWAAACSTGWSAKTGPPWRLEGSKEGLSPLVSGVVEGTTGQQAGFWNCPMPTKQILESRRHHSFAENSPPAVEGLGQPG